MKEDFLHHLWKSRNLKSPIHYTSTGQRIEIVHPGQHNHDSGPDFFNAKIRIDDLLWAGNVEIHVKSSDWMLHGHSTDRAYDSVILHVVYDDDKPVRIKHSLIPTLQLKGQIDVSFMEKFNALSPTNEFIPCSSMLNKYNPDKKRINKYLGRLYAEKLEGKSKVIKDLLHNNNGDWEETSYQFLARSLGQGKNRVPFEFLAKSVPLQILKCEQENLDNIEALFLGQAGFLNNEPGDDYSVNLSSLYNALRSKYNLVPIESHLWKFSRLRPGNFPTLRIAQLAELYRAGSINFKSLLKIQNTTSFFKLFNVKASNYWSNHSKIGRISAIRSTSLGRESIKGILVNGIVPLMFEYGRSHAMPKVMERALEIMSQLSAENNSIVAQWKQHGFSVESAQVSQALLHLKSAYCDHKKCLSCAIGTDILK